MVLNKRHDAAISPAATTVREAYMGSGPALGPQSFFPPR